MSKKHFLILFLILILGAFFRLWQLNSIPPGLYPDEAINGNEALSTPLKVFYPENNGREGLYINLISLSFKTFGVSIWSLRIVSAITGILTILGLYLLTVELFQIADFNFQNSRAIALLSSFFLATSFWHINFSRIGFRGILVPFILVFAFYFLLKGFRNQKKLFLIVGGVFFGLGFYTYPAFRLAVLLLLIVLIPWWLIYKKQGLQKIFILYTLYFILTTFLVALPIGIYFLENPSFFFSRMSGISVFNQNSNPPFSQFQALGKSFLAHLAMFNFKGDGNWRHNFSGSPQLLWPVGILFLIGLFYSFYNLRKSIKTNNKKQILLYGFLISWCLILLLPGILTYEGIPHALRTIGVIPASYIIAGLGGWYVYQLFELNVKNKKLLILASLVFILTVSVVQFDKYFVKWGKNPEVEGAFSKDYVEIGNYLNSLSSETKKYVIVNQPGVPVPYPDGIPMPAQTIMFIQATKGKKGKTSYILPEDFNQIKIKSKETVIVPMRYDENLLNEISKKFPGGEILKKNGFYVYKINPGK
ncbi:glycosyltransferase family 39 protein [bacterium]|nr:glycosyltransferase family 39 protein [bacterium]